MSTQTVFELLIVEDDRIIREGLIHAAPWEQLGYHVTAAADAQEAIAIAARGIDVVLTDIKMPGRSGLELIEQLRRTQPELPCVILSGYSEFEYARRAVSLNVVEYLTKPVDPERLESLFADIARRLSNRKEQGRAMQDSLKSFLYSLLECSMPPEHISARLQILGLPADNGRYQLLWLDVAQDAESLAAKPPFADAWQHFPFRNGYLFLFREPVSLEAVTAALPGGVRAALSVYGEGLHQLTQRRTEVEAAYNQLFFTGEMAAQYVQPLPAAETLPVAIPALCQQIADEYTKLEEKRMKELLSQLTEQIARYAPTAAQARSVLNHLGTTLYGLENQSYTRAKELQQAQTLAQAQQTLWSHIQELLAQKRAVISAASVTLSQRASAYIAAHLSDKLTLEEIASALYVNPSYLSRVFKKETGENIGMYVNEQKIEKAKEYMRRMDVGICDVSLRVGFTDYSYFCVLFKKHTGETPLGYRKRILYGTEKKK